MTYSYSGPLTYGPQTNGVYYDEMTYKKPSALPAATAGVLVGGIGGAVVGGKKNPYVNKKGEILDSFAKTTYEKYVDKAAGAAKESYHGGQEILAKIDSVKNPEELKALLSSNQEAAKDICAELKQTPEEFLTNVSEKNLNANKKIIKEKINAGNNTRFQDMKNQIQACWDADKKKFVKNENVKDDVYKAIKKSTNGIKGKIIAKYAAIGAAVAGVVGFVLGKLFIK